MTSQVELWDDTTHGRVTGPLVYILRVEVRHKAMASLAAVHAIYKLYFHFLAKAF